MSVAYLQLHNNWYTHPKFLEIKGETFKQFMIALAYCADLENDGWLPNEKILGIMSEDQVNDLHQRRLLDRIYQRQDRTFVRVECSDSKLIPNPLIPSGNPSVNPSVNTSVNLDVTKQNTPNQIIQSNQIKSSDIPIGWAIHNYTKYQPSKEMILKRRKEWSDRKAVNKSRREAALEGTQFTQNMGGDSE
jgi:hypothetical protein